MYSEEGCCKGVSDKDFIFEVFLNSGFVPNADQYLNGQEEASCGCDNGEPAAMKGQGQNEDK